MLPSRVGVRRVVAQLRVLHHHRRHIDPKAVHATVKPEARHVEHRVSDLGVPPVQVRLLGKEGVEVVLRARLVPGPGRAGEHADPVVRQAAIRLWVTPHVPVGLRVVARRSRFGEPRVSIAGVIRDVVDEDSNVPLVRGGHQSIEVGERAEDGIHVRVIGHVVAEVGHRRGIEGRDPDGVDTQPGEVVQPLADPVEVARAVAVRVREASRVDLVDDCALPPPR